MTVDRPRFSTADILAVQAAIDRLKAEVFKLTPPLTDCTKTEAGIPTSVSRAARRESFISQ